MQFRLAKLSTYSRIRPHYNSYLEEAQSSECLVSGEIKI